MGVFEHFPYTNFHEQNIDWLIRLMKELDGDMDKLKAKMAKIGVTITETVAAKLEKMLQDGDFEAIINDELFKIPVHAGNNIVFIGDSWTYGSGATNRLTERFTTLIAKNFGMTEFNFGVGASGFTRPNTFISQVETANSSMTETEKKMTSICLITGGVNDIRWSAETTLLAFSAAVVACVERAKAVFPNAQIVLAIGTTTNDSYTNTNRHWYYYAMKAVKQQHSEGRVLIIDHVGAAINGVAANYQSDNLHPNTLGHSLLAGFLTNAIQGGGTDTEYYVGYYALDANYASYVRTPHVFRQTENILFGEGIIELAQEITTNTVIGSYEGPFGYDNVYLTAYHGNQPVASVAITASGSLRIIPNPGVTLSSGWQLRIMDHVELFRSLIS